MQTFGQIIRAARQRSGLGQRELAHRVGVDYTYISKIETDAGYMPSEEVIQKLAEHLGLDDDELMCLTGRLPARFIPFLQAHYQSMPTLMNWLHNNPDRLATLIALPE